MVPVGRLRIDWRLCKNARIRDDLSDKPANSLRSNIVGRYAKVRRAGLDASRCQKRAPTTSVPSSNQDEALQKVGEERNRSVLPSRIYPR